jgi:catechol 2,3-dioxygenase-like lactoylglutathione lyase family enzyme
VSHREGIEVLGIDNILLSVDDLVEACQFYGERLGPPATRHSSEPGYGWRRAIGRRELPYSS